ncbi:MAG TPA: hypothetical protein VFQ35_08570 [Polyangiaceae bacterium]|nr:hypothetical protein [Polyangiaceae bacterium]
MDGSILSHTRYVAAELAHAFQNDPEGELTLWATTAQQREAMVVRLYDSAALEARFPTTLGEPGMLNVVRKVIGGIWAQERSHTTLVQSIRILGETRMTALQTLMGDIEGRLTHAATASSWLRSVASFLVGVGRTMGQAPEFTKAFQELTPRQFFRFSHELETTAKEGYVRILELLERLESAGTADASESSSVERGLRFGVTAPYEFAKTLAEECFHAAVFEQLEAWLERDGESFGGLPARDAVLRLRELAIEHLSLGSKSLGASGARLDQPWLKSVGSSRLVSDGGLGELFEEYGVKLPPLLP